MAAHPFFASNRFDFCELLMQPESLELLPFLRVRHAAPWISVGDAADDEVQNMATGYVLEIIQQAVNAKHGVHVASGHYFVSTKLHRIVDRSLAPKLVKFLPLLAALRDYQDSKGQHSAVFSTFASFIPATALMEEFLTRREYCLKAEQAGLVAVGGGTPPNNDFRWIALTTGGSVILRDLEAEQPPVASSPAPTPESPAVADVQWPVLRKLLLRAEVRIPPPLGAAHPRSCRRSAWERPTYRWRSSARSAASRALPSRPAART